MTAGQREQDEAAAGWGALVIWKCETKNHEAMRQALLDFLGPPHLAGKE